MSDARLMQLIDALLGELHRRNRLEVTAEDVDRVALAEDATEAEMVAALEELAAIANALAEQ